MDLLNSEDDVYIKPLNAPKGILTSKLYFVEPDDVPVASDDTLVADAYDP